MSYKSRLLVVTLMGLFLTACASKNDSSTGGATATNTSANTGTSTGTGSNSGVRSTSRPPVLSSGGNAYGTRFTAEELRRMGIEGDPLNYKVVYFQYNSSRIDQRSDVIVRAHARHLQNRSNTRVSLEGHADERGTRDFNLALGERRAQEVQSLLKATGAASPVNTISYGEERPVETAHNESAWTRNRRVEILY